MHSGVTPACPIYELCIHYDDDDDIFNSLLFGKKWLAIIKVQFEVSCQRFSSYGSTGKMLFEPQENLSYNTMGGRLPKFETPTDYFHHIQVLNVTVTCVMVNIP